MEESRRKFFSDKDIFPKIDNNRYDIKKYKEELEEQISLSNKKKQFLKEKEKMTPSKKIKDFYLINDQKPPTRKKVHFDSLTKSFNNQLSRQNEIYDILCQPEKKKQNLFSTTLPNSFYNDQKSKFIDVNKNENEKKQKILKKANSNFIKKDFYTPRQNTNIFTRDLNGEFVDALKEKKLKERRDKFEKYVLNELPQELNNYIKNYFDCTFINFKKDIKTNQEKMNDELKELKRFTYNLKNGEERAFHDLKNLKNEMKIMETCEMERRNKLFESLSNNREISHNKKYDFNWERGRCSFPTNLEKIDQSKTVKDILDSFEHLINY